MSEDIYVNKGTSTDGRTYPRPEWWPPAVPEMVVHVGGYENLLVREVWVEDTYRAAPRKIQGGVVIDLGANVGVFTLMAAKLGAARVIACEPNHDNFERLKVNISLNPALATVIEPRHVAVHASRGTVRIDGAWGAARVGENGDEIASVPLADVVGDAPEIAFLKVDVEGSEFAIIEAAPVELIGRCKWIAMELHDSDAPTWQRLIDKLKITHRVEVVGKPATGGSLWAERKA